MKLLSLMINFWEKGIDTDLWVIEKQQVTLSKQGWETIKS